MIGYCNLSFVPIIHEFKARLSCELAYLEFGVWVEDHLRQVRDGPVVHHSLGQLWRVFGDVAEGGSCDAFEGDLGLHETQHQQGDSTRVHDRLRQRCTVRVREAGDVETNT